jgi:DNA polymerase III subunit delta
MFYILHGDEEFTRSEEVARLKAHVATAGLGDLNIAVLDGRQVALNELISACNTLPFLGDKRLIIVEGLLQRFEPRERARGKASAGDATSTPARETESVEKLAAYLPHLPPSTRLVFVESRTLGRNNPILKLAQGDQESHVREFKAPGDDELPEWIRRRAEKKRASIAREAVALLATLIGPNLRLLDQELEKLAALANYARPITGQDVHALVSAGHEADIFALVDTLGVRNRERAMQQLQELLLSGANELYLLTMIARQIRLILAAKDLAQEKKLKPEEIRRELHISHGFIVDKLLRQGQQFSAEELEAIQGRVLETDQAIKTGRIEPRLALELLTLEICHRRPHTA